MTAEVEREIIAERTVYAIDVNSRGFEVHLILGNPYPWGENSYRCPVAAIGLPHGRLADIAGADSWQALMLAQALLNFLLSEFVRNGGTLYWEKEGPELKVSNLFTDPIRSPAEFPQLTDEEYQANIDSLTCEELQKIDEALLTEASHRFRKVARVVGFAIGAVDKRIPDTFYANRVKKLVKEGRLTAEGDLNEMGRSEVRLPDK